MQRCHACQHELDQPQIDAGRCAACGAAVPASLRVRPPQDDPQATVDSAESFELIVDDQDAPADDDAQKTIDLSSSDTHPTVNIRPKNPTIADRGDATVEFDSLSLDAGPASNPTVQGTPGGGAGEGATVEGAGGRSTHPMHGDFTIDFGGEDPDLSAHMSSEWGLSVAPGFKQNQTLRQSGTVNEFISKNTRSTLQVKNRSLRLKVDESEGEMTPLVPGEVPDYELLDMIGQGGMGVVYAATQSSIARTVAVKMFKPGAKVTNEQRDKFISEAVVTGELDHPNIVPIYDMGASEEGALFYSMKRVKGTPWDDVLTKRSLDENLNILMRVADAVAFAHAGGVVHRDLKPENVMLGDYGEVLVMDWGLARVTKAFRNASAIYQADSLGGTPAYMAPEMARGPIENIDPRSDVYLLGAILYEIITGRAPHSGRDVMQCLMAAANNKIDDIEQTGELVDIAMQAMQTRPEDRYQTVKDLQAAIQQYQSHSESLLLTDNARQHLEQAHESSDYQYYARALYGFQEAITLWPENDKAVDFLERTRLDYAGAALASEDFDLGVSLLSGDTPEQEKLLLALERGKLERDARQRRLTFFKRLAAAALVAILLGGTFFTVALRRERNEAVTQRARAEEKKQEAEAAKVVADEKRAEAVTAKEAEAKQREEAERARADAERSAEAERLAAEEARVQRAAAEQAQKLEEAAKIAEEYEAYVARIGLAASKIDENAFDSAREILAECPPTLRNWEWGRLNYLCGLSPRHFDSTGPVEAVAYSPDGRLIASGDWGGRLIVRDAASGEEQLSERLAQYVHSVAFSPDGKQLAAGCSDGVIHLLDVSSGKRQRTLRGSEQGVLSVRFSPDGGRLVTAGYDSRVRLWDLNNGAKLQELQDHSWWVWSAGFSPDASQLVTASQDGKSIVYQWDGAKYAVLTVFDQHEGPVYAAAFSPDGQRVATAGYDNSVCLWSPAAVQAADLASRVDGDAPQAEVDFTRLTGHRGPVRGVVFSADGRTLLSASYDNSLRLWDADDHHALKTLRGHGSGVMTCALAPGGKWAASGGQDQQVRLWDIDGYEESRILRGRVMNDHADAVLSARFSHDGSRVITASRDRSSKLWDSANGKLLTTFQEGHEYLASSAVLFDAGRRMATSAGDSSVRVWDVGAGSELFSLRPTGRAGTLAVSTDGEWIATGGPDNQARLWPAIDGAEPVVLSGHVEEVTAAAIADGASLAATGDNRGVIRVWRRDGENWLPGPVLKGHSRAITGLSFVGDRLISSSGDNTCGQWDVTAGQEDRRLVLKHPDWVNSLDVSPDGRLAITTCEDGRVRVWRLGDASVVAEHRAGESTRGAAYTRAGFSPDGRLALLTSPAARVVEVWPWLDGQPRPALRAGQQLKQLWAAEFAGDAGRVLTIGGNDAQLWDVGARQPIVSFSPHGAVSSASLSPDGRLAATGSWDNSVKLWSTETGRSVRKLEHAHQGYVNSVMFSPVSNDQLLTASDDGAAILWDLSGEQPQRRVLRGHAGRVLQAVYSSDGRQVLTAGADKTARLWSRDGAEVKVFRGHDWAVLACAISPDGRHVVTGSQDNTAIVWSVASGEQVATLSGHTASVTSVAFSADGRRVLTGSQDRAAKLWDAQSGKEILTLGGHTREVTSVAFSPDGRSALTASRDGAAMLWLAEPWNGQPVAASVR
ncbi:Serine/threonine-protein kinase PknD [Posidoniimonas polymericola]|uniref:Serine/threonine-protein kinase PknD n=1 Tax=Posidoniimonas polymericola TaxID=2528002 RepID=A0A5C5YRQ3_9BACT|nr:protein kinase [Posidoniimonas polymericola]TWT77631.1 Serine/threonine-protein kinase PknD [Posidoniimonas polymericola]